ncbi:MAG: hypothetical protein VB061_00005 [Christensenella sp.]|nr:hypothetical protein [Christensenella sp.]
MIDSAVLSLVTPETAATYAATLEQSDIPALIERLASAEDKIRYPAFLLLKERSVICADVYPFWDALDEKLTHENSYQRSIGAMLLSANARHDAQGKLKQTLPHYLALLNDPKPITVRQCAQALPEMLRAKPEYAEPIGNAILSVSLLDYKETMRKLILLDFLETLILVRSLSPSEALEAYFFSILSGSILDEKAKKQLRARLAL